MSIKGFYKQVQFKCDELMLFYNMPVVTPDDTPLENCPHIDKLVCSRAHELAPDKCKTERKCELLEGKDKIFTDIGISAIALRDLDEQLQKPKNS